jgi:uncharacterized repeat protein (TIGR03803 family)
LSADGTYKVLHYFKPGEGIYPSALIQADDGDLYGVALEGGANGVGTAFRMTRDGEVSVLHDFSSDGADGFYPQGPLVQESDGRLYGTTFAGGCRNGCGFGEGTVYRMTLDGASTVLHTFGPKTPGQYPFPGLTRAPGRRLIGVTIDDENPHQGIHVFGVGEPRD